MKIIPDFIKGIFKGSYTPAHKQGAFAAMVGNSQAVWAERDYENFARETYMKNVIAYACIDRIAKAVSMVPWVLYKTFLDEREIDTEHPFNRVMQRANPDESWQAFLYSVTSYLCMAGNTFIERLSPDTGPNAGIPMELWTLRPDRMVVDVDKKAGVKTAYIYKPIGVADEERFPIDRATGNCDVLHIKTFHPLNEYYGLAPTEPAGKKIDASNSMDAWNKSLMDNSGRPGMMIFFKDTLGDDQLLRLQKDFRDNLEGPKNAGKTHLFEGATDAKPYGFSPSEMDWINSNLALARGICVAWGVPPQLVGLPDVSTYSNYQEARTAFYEDTVIHYLTLLRSEFNRWIFIDALYSIDFRLEDVPAMQYKQTLRWDRAQKSDFLTINEKRAMVGLDAIDGGDTVLQPATMIPLISDTGSGGTGTPPPSPGKNQESDEIKLTEIILHPPESKPYPNEHSCRINPPGKFDSMRRQNNWRQHDGKRIDVIWGIKGGKSEIQALRMPKDEWSPDSAKSYCDAQGGSFEAAATK